MAERKPFRLISPEPELAKALRRLEKEIKIQMLPTAYRDWLLTWVEDIGVIMRSRSYLAGTVAMYVLVAGVTVPFMLVPELKRFKFIARVLGGEK